jgi:putative sigma-54 modulation protein
MQTTFTFRNLETSEALKSLTLKKLGRLDKYLIKPITAHIIFNVERFQQQIEITLNANGVQYVSHEKTPNMYTSIDGAIAKLERQLKRYKEQLKRHKDRNRKRP